MKTSTSSRNTFVPYCQIYTFFFIPKNRQKIQPDFIELQYSMRMEARHQLLHEQKKFFTICMYYHSEGEYFTPCESNACLLTGVPAATATAILENIIISFQDGIRNILCLVSPLQRYTSLKLKGSPPNTWLLHRIQWVSATILGSAQIK